MLESAHLARRMALCLLVAGLAQTSRAAERGVDSSQQLRAWLAKGAVAALSDPDEKVRLRALDRLGELAQHETAEPIAGFLSGDHTDSEKRGALTAYAKLHVRDRRHLSEIKQYLYDPYGGVFGAAAEALAAMGAAKELRPRFVQLLHPTRDGNEYVQRGAVAYGLAAGGALSEFRTQLSDLLDDRGASDRDEILAGVEAAGMAQDFLPQIRSILGEPQSSIAARDASVGAMAAVASAGLGREVLPEIERSLSQEGNPNLRAQAIRAIETSGLDARYRPQITQMLEVVEYAPAQFQDDYGEVQLAAVEGIVSGGAAQAYAAEITKGLLRAYVLDPESEYLASAIKAIASKDHGALRLPILRALSQRSTQEAALEGLATAFTTDQYREAIQGLLRSDSIQKPQLLFLALGSQRCTLEDQVRLAAGLHFQPDSALDYKLTVYSCSGGGRAARLVMALIPRGERKTGEAVLGASDRRQAFEALTPLAALTDVHYKVREDLGAALADLAELVPWRAGDLPRLQAVRDALARDFHTQAYAHALTLRIKAIEGPHIAGKVTLRALLVGLAHVAFWFALIVLYPRSRMVQAIFFWNPWVRRIVGFGYVGFLLTWVPFLRRRLLAPFRDSLLGDARLGTFSEAAYYARSNVRDAATGATAAVTATLMPPVRGQVVLEGESGLGKTMFLRHLAFTSPKTAVFLLAASCSAGVLAAIQERLKGKAGDATYLRNLLWSGAVEIYLDGLNEVTADTRAKIASFMDDSNANLVVTTQPLEWSPPGTARLYVLQPLAETEIRDFLEHREPFLPQDAPVRGQAYRDECGRFLAQALDAAQNKDLLASILRVLSNPMDLTVVAEMITRRKEPDLFHLQQQQYDLMAADYQTIHLEPFPLAAFAEEVYALRRADRPELPGESFAKALHVMERFKLVLRREEQAGTTWLFRHERIADFFVVHAFLGRDNPRPQEHLADPRFRGVYFMLATLLPFDDALNLRELLLQHAADTKDHTVSDTFIQLVRSRQSAMAA